MWKENLEIPERERKREKHGVEEPQLFSSQLSESSQHRGHSEETFEAPGQVSPYITPPGWEIPIGNNCLAQPSQPPELWAK